MHSLLLPFIVVTAFIAPRDIKPITQRELVQHTQQLSDAVAVGDKAPWQLYYADDALYFDEKGHAMDKKALLADLSPLPKGYSGTIHVVKPQSRLLGDTAVLAYDLDETETIRYYEDPAAGAVKTSLLDDYTGSYQLAPGVTLKITRDGDKLYTQRGEHPRDLLLPEVADLFFRRGVEGRRLFHRNASGKVDSLIDRRNNEDLVWKKL